ncbi:MAG: DUF742 domain-containing protein [Mycobacteriaceae bacterium]|nr:DUF742 domain-containing protein [Mycobacteriaceae bacterium]
MTARGRDPDLVRAYVRTGGRTRPNRALDLVTLVHATQAAVESATAAQVAAPDAKRVLEMCRGGALSLAEISAHLDLPTSVVKILASDLLDDGLLKIPAAKAAADTALLEEVLNGLRALTA